MPEVISLPDLLLSIGRSGGDYLFTKILQRLAPIIKNPSVLDPEDEPALASEWIAACLEPDIERNEATGAQGLPTSLGLHFDDGTCELHERDRVWTISPATVMYWRERARLAQNPEMSARYAHLAWAFARQVGLNSSIDDARLARAQYLVLAASASEERSVLAVDALRRAAILTVGLPGAMGPDSHEEVLSAYIDLVSRLPEPQCPLVRHLIMGDLILGRFSGRFKLTEAHEALALNQVRKEFDRDHPSNWVENAKVMARYFTARERKAEVESLVLELVHRLNAGCDSGDSMLFQHWTRQAIPLVQSLGMFTEEEMLLRAIERVGPGVLAQMHTIVWSAPIPAHVIDRFREKVNAISLADALACLRDALPGAPEVQRELEVQSNKMFQQLGLRITLSADAVPSTVTTGPRSEEEAKTGAWKSAVESMSPSAQLLWRVIMEVHRPSQDELLGALSEPGWIPPGHELILRRALEALVVGDDLVFLHLVVPQFEPLLRHLNSTRGRSTYHVPPTQPWDMETDSLGYLLGSEVASPAIGDEGLQFLRTLLVEELGFNLRNRLAHGHLKVDDFTRQLTVSCTQALLVLARSCHTERPSLANDVPPCDPEHQP